MSYKSTEQLDYYRPSRFAIALKKIAALVKPFLPRDVYDRLYDYGFSVYRGLLRTLYLRHLIVSRLRNDGRASYRAWSVRYVMPYSLVGASGLEATYDAVVDIEERRVNGNIVECGVAQGGSAALMALASKPYNSSRSFWLFDSFEGLPEPSEQDYVDGVTGVHVRELPPGSCLGQQEEVEKFLFDDLKFDRGRFTLVKGWFENTVEQNADKIGNIAVLRIDADWYESVKCCLENLFDNVAPGGYVIIDDYGTCFGARKAVDEFLASRGLDVELVHDGRGGCHFVKPVLGLSEE